MYLQTVVILLWAQHIHQQKEYNIVIIMPFALVFKCYAVIVTVVSLFSCIFRFYSKPRSAYTHIKMKTYPPHQTTP